jgi:glycosyltransferase involved in cell wall biosynthesis
MYVRHRTNSWRFDCGQLIDPRGWIELAEPLFLQDDRAFYAARSVAASPSPTRGSTHPLVTCIMPTANRRRFVPCAIDYFQRQSYPARELIVLDDGEDSVQDLVPSSDQIRYVRLTNRRSLGAKRNLACELASGEIIAHWDDDDWMADWRLAYQVAALSKRSAALCGLSQLLFSEPRNGRAWVYACSRPGAWVAGGTMCYHKALWRRFPFPELTEGEDTCFVMGIPDEWVMSLENNRFYVATVHAGNTSPKHTTDVYWKPITSAEIETLIGADWANYAGAACG